MYVVPKLVDENEHQFADQVTGTKEGTKPVFILVLGMTGAGKSTLVQRCTGEIDAQVGHGLQSCKPSSLPNLNLLVNSSTDDVACVGTGDLSVYSFFHDNHHVHMIDTPGFDDTSRSDIDTLRTISNYLSVSFTNGVRIGGIIYLHRVSDNRLSGSSFKNLRMFKKLSGASAWPHTIIGTTMWQSDQHEQGERREKELVDNEDYFGEMLAQGTKVFRIAEHGSGAEEEKESAIRIVSYLVQRMSSSPEVELEIQRQLVLEDRTLDATSAGQEALGDLYGLQCQLARQLQDARQEMQDAVKRRDVEHMQQLRTLEDDCKRRIEETETQQERLKTSLMDMNETEMERVQARLDDMEAGQRALLTRKQRELTDMEESLKLMREQSALEAARKQREVEEMEESMKRMREQSALDAKQLRERDRKVQALKEKRHAAEKINRECEQNVTELRYELAQQRAQLESIEKTKGAMRYSIGEGIAKGAAGAVMTTVLPLGKYSLFD